MVMAWSRNVLNLLSLSIIVIELNCFDLNDDMVFLEDFFRDKNVMITINSCWTINGIKTFTESNMQSKNPKQIAVYKNLSLERMDDFFHYISGSNWFVMDLKDCKGYENVFRAINDRNLFRYPLKYLILLESTNYPSFLRLIESFSILPMSNVIIACLEKFLVTLYQPYKIGENKSLIIENYGNWSREKGVMTFYKKSLTDRRRNFQNYELQVGTVVYNESSVEEKNIDDITEFREEEPYFFQDIPNMYNLLDYLNASFAFRIFKSYGYLNHSTGKFDGLAQDLYEGKSHISGVSLILSEERNQIIEYIKCYNYWATKAKFVLKKPSTSYVDNIYYTTFSNKVWIASLVILLIFAIVLYGLLNWETKNMNKNQDIKKITASDITLISLEAVCQQGTYMDSKTFSGRAIILILFTAFMFIYIAYSSYILVLLQSTTPIHSIRELVDSRIECGGFNISFMMAYYTATKDDALIDLYRKKIYPNKFYSLEDGLRKVREGNFAFQINLGPAYNYILKRYTNYDICKLQELPGYMNVTPSCYCFWYGCCTKNDPVVLPRHQKIILMIAEEMYIAVPKTSQYKKLFKTGLQLGEERGLQNRIKNRMSIKPKCYSSSGNFQSVRIFDCHSVFVLYGMGVILSLVVLLAENLLAKRAKNRSNKN